MAKFFLVLTLLAAGAAAGLGWVTYQKIGEVRTDLKTTKATLKSTQNELAATKNTLKQTQDELTATHSQLDTANATIATDKTMIDTLNNEKTALQGQLDTANGKLADLQKQIDELQKKFNPTTDGGPGKGIEQIISELKKQIDEQKQLNETLTKQVAEANKHVETLTKAEETRKAGLLKPGIQGIVMAVNPGYGFVVISLGDHQGAVPNGEVIVERDGRQIAKLKITTVEPALSVADIIPDSLAKGQRVLPGDKVIFSGNMVQP